MDKPKKLQPVDLFKSVLLFQLETIAKNNLTPDLAKRVRVEVSEEATKGSELYRITVRMLDTKAE